MPVFVKIYLRAALSLLLLMSFVPARASHLLGDEFTYKYRGDTLIYGASFHNYEVTLVTYADCINGQPEAIAQDNPAYFGIYDGSGVLFKMDTAVFCVSIVSLPGMLSSPCGSGTMPDICVLKKTFTKQYYLPAGSTTSYTIAYQRCCRNAALSNIIDPGNVGPTYFCTIPVPGIATNNNCAVFTNYPPEAISINTSWGFDCSATDADGDSLTYELCTSYSGASDANIKPNPLPPPYAPANYIPGLSYSNPVSCSVPLSVNTATGWLTGTPNLAGRYLVAVACHEWRAGVMINTSRREFEIMVLDVSLSTYHPFAGNDTAIMVGDSIQFHASGAVSYGWAPGIYLSDTGIDNPWGHFPVAGSFTYTLHGVSDSGCHGSSTITVLVVPYAEYRMPNAFTPNGDGVNDLLTPIPIFNSTLVSFKVYNRDGKLLHTGTSQGDGWDGMYNGKKQETGTYLWELFYNDNNGVTREMKGSAMLIR